MHRALKVNGFHIDDVVTIILKYVLSITISLHRDSLIEKDSL